MKKGWKRGPDGKFYPPVEDKAPEQFAEVAAIDGASNAAVTALEREVANLRAKLAASESARTEAQQSALDMAKSQGLLMQTPITEIPTGRTVTISKCTSYKRVGFEHGRPVREPVFEEIEAPTFYYKIDMPPCGGIDLKLNGQPFYQGMVYEFDIDTLRTVKDIVFRTWRHDAEIHGNADENAYRPKQNVALSARAYR